MPDTGNEDFWPRELDDASRRYYKDMAEKLNLEARHSQRFTVGQLVEALRAYNPDLPVSFQTGAIYCQFDGIAVSSHPSMGGQYIAVRTGRRC